VEEGEQRKKNQRLKEEKRWLPFPGKKKSNKTEERRKELG